MSTSVAQSLWRKAPSIRYRCGSCSKLHQGLPELTFSSPHPYARLPEAERAARARLGSDLCVIDETRFFLRAVLQLPIAGYDDRFGFGVWAEVGATDFRTYFQNFDNTRNSHLGPFEGKLANALPGFPETGGLNCEVHLQDGGRRPVLALGPASHPLSVAHVEGLAIDRAIEIVRDSRIGAFVVIG
ncbi:MAG: DUF2199 domain-containing protein [Hyphomicrobiaceae bacterium]